MMGKRTRTAVILAVTVTVGAALAGCGASQVEAEAVEIVWPRPPEIPRIRFLRSFRDDSAIHLDKSFFGRILAIIGGEEPPIGLKKPYAIHVDRRGRIFVGDTGWGKVLVFDSKNHTFDFWGIEGAGSLSRPTGITSDADGNIYVADGAESRVVCFSPEGEYLRAYGRTGELDRPTGVAINVETRRMYVADARLHQIVVFDLGDSGRQSVIGERGIGEGQFNFPTHLAIAPGGNLVVMDTFNFRVQVFDPDGKFIRAFGKNCNVPGCMVRSKGIAVDSDGNIYVADAAFNLVQIFSAEGALLMGFGGGGQQPGQLWLPAGMYIDHEDKIYVADSYNYRVNVYQYLSGGEAPPE